MKPKASPTTPEPSRPEAADTGVGAPDAFRGRLPAAIRGRSGVLLGAILLMPGIYGTYLGSEHLLLACRDHWLPKNFSTVKSNVLYRSGQMRLGHFGEMVQQHGIRTVVCLNPGAHEAEQLLAEAMGVKYVVLGMPGCGRGRPEQFAQFLRIMGNPNNCPVLVHCAAGSYRTGAAIALYRMLHEGWSLDDAVREMRCNGFAGRKVTIEHIRKTYATLPPQLTNRFLPAESVAATEGRRAR